MRKMISLLLALLLFICPAIAEEEEEWTLEDMLADLDPELVADIFVNAEEAQSLAEDDAVASIYEPDGSIPVLPPSAAPPASPTTSGTRSSRSTRATTSLR